VLVGQMQHHASLSRDVKHRHPHEGVPPPAGRWRLDPLAFVVWQRRAGLLERVADAGRSGRRDEPADGHHHPQGHETCRFCARARSGHTLGRFEDAAAARGLRLPCVSGPYLERGHLDRVACGRREDDTTVLVDTRLPGRAPRRQGSDALGDALVGLGARARTPPLRRLGGGQMGLSWRNVAGQAWAPGARAWGAAAAPAPAGRPSGWKAVTARSLGWRHGVSTGRWAGGWRGAAERRPQRGAPPP
jgi:hypothetical protein